MGDEIKHNPAQERVINEVYGQTVVIACPGSGKTTTILRRINYMIQEEEINPSEILMITFTKATAKEMGERYVRMFGSNPGVTFCTIHSLCMSFLKKFGGLNLNSVLSDNYSILAGIIRSDERHRDISDLETFTKEVQMDITVVKSNSSIDIEEYVPRCCQDAQFFRDIYYKYETEKEMRGIIDYDDLLINAYRLMKEEKEYVDYVRDMYGYIHVDEYQDTNFIQRDIVYMIAGRNGNITVVGDDDQSIYSFRGARPEIMQDFLVHYKGAREIYMSTNYRSDKSIISSASKLIDRNMVRFKKDIQASSAEDGNISVQCYGSKKDELMHMSGDIMKLMNSGDTLDSIAVLYRNNSQAEQAANALWQYKIPFYSNEPIPNRYRHDMFHDIMAYHKMACGKAGGADQDAFMRTIQHPNRYFTNYRNMRFDDSMQEMKRKAYNPNLEDWKNENTAASIEKYHKLICTLKFLPLRKALDTIYSQGGYGKYLKDYAEYRNILFDELQDQWQMYINDIERNNIKTFEEWEDYGRRFSFMLDKAQKDGKGVCLSTMHKSKGCEWDKVFIIDCMEKTCPYVKATTKEEVEEERRLFYVAMTRAKHDLRLYCYKSSKGISKSAPSRFLAEAGLMP